MTHRALRRRFRKNKDALKSCLLVIYSGLYSHWIQSRSREHWVRGREYTLKGGGRSITGPLHTKFNEFKIKTCHDFNGMWEETGECRESALEPGNQLQNGILKLNRGKFDFISCPLKHSLQAAVERRSPPRSLLSVWKEKHAGGMD